MSNLRQKLILGLLAAGLSAALIGSGILLGIWMEQKTFRRHFEEVWKAETLGRLLQEEERAGMAAVYDDPAQALPELDNYSWSVRTVPTPFVGTAPEPGTHDNARINSLQFRSSSEIALPKPAGVRRILITGGSTAFGAGASSQEKTIGGFVEFFLNEGGRTPRYEVFTLASPSWASTHERIAIENRLSGLSPDLVVSLSGVNDVHWGRLGRNVYWFRTYQEELFWRLTRAAYRAYSPEDLTDVEVLSEEPVAPETVARRLERNVRLSWGALYLEEVPYLFALQPSLYSTRKPLSPREQSRLTPEYQQYYEECYLHIRSRLSSIEWEGFDFVDLSGVFDEDLESEEIFIDSYHFGDRGNRLLGLTLSEWIRLLLESS